MITYPVDAANTRWALWSISGNTLIKENKPYPRADGEEIVGLDPDLVPLLEVYEAEPAYDPLTHKVEATTAVDVNANTHTHSFNVVALSQAELDAIAAQQQAEADAAAAEVVYQADVVQAKAVYQDLKNHVGTAGGRMTRVENVLAYLVKHMFGAEDD